MEKHPGRALSGAAARTGNLKKLQKKINKKLERDLSVMENHS